MGNLLRYYSDAEGPGHCGYGVFIAEDADGAGDKGSGNNTAVNVETNLVAFMVDFHNWGLFLACRNIRIFGGSAFRLKEFYCKWRRENEEHNQLTTIYALMKFQIALLPE